MHNGGTPQGEREEKINNGKETFLPAESILLPYLGGKGDHAAESAGSHFPGTLCRAQGRGTAAGPH